MKIKHPEFIKSSTCIDECPENPFPEYAFIGRSNVGKSSLINMLTGRKSLAKISSTPGKTQLINHFLIDKSWYIVDLPGYGYAKVSLTDREKWHKMIYRFLEKRKTLVSVLVLIDSRIKPQDLDIKFMEWLGVKAIPFCMVFTKSDKLKTNELNLKLENYKEEMGKQWNILPPIIVTSATTKLGKEKLLKYIDTCNKSYNDYNK